MRLPLKPVLAALTAAGAAFAMWWVIDLARSHDELERALEAAEAAAAVQADIVSIVSAGRSRAQVAALDARADLAFLEDVVDDQTCRSPSVDRAFDVLRDRQARRQR